MSKAEELLDSLSDEQIAAYSATSVNEPHIVVGADRFITVPETLKRIAVEHDHNVETVTFDCPRYWDDHDLSTMIIYINYKLANGLTGSYIAENISAEDDIIHFTWTISRAISAAKGNVIFLVCAKSTDDEGNEELHWNSELNTDMYVSEGLETDFIVEEEYPDIVTQLLERMTVVEGINVTREYIDGQVEAVNAANATLEEIKNNASEIRNSYANAIKANVSGKVVEIKDDISPLEHEVDVWVHSKNLIPLPYYHGNNITQQGVEITVDEDGVITFNGTALADSAYKLINKANIVVKGRYTLSGCDGGSTTTYYLQPFIDDVGTSTVLNGSRTYEWDGVLTSLAFFFKAGTTFNNVQFKPQLEQGDTATTYEKWIDPSTVAVRRYGKNVLDLSVSRANCETNYPNYTTITANIVNGTRSILYLNYLKQAVQAMDGHYLTFSVSNLAPDSGIALQIQYASGGNDTVESYDSKRVTMLINHKGRTVTYVIAYPIYRKTSGTDTTSVIKNLMLEFSDTASPFEPFNGVKATPAADGTVEGITSLTPTTTIITSNKDMFVECEYNRDMNKVIQGVETDMTEALEALNSYAESLIGG